ncbi:MAG: helix-turn-helix transcriptional regulator [Thiofilum sp.]|uniref:LuxR C-terminal-related transcriptional regulator n=1 Tax=Thiofilum sp. TaxID=2212733 RepID=UPI0025E34303|nr:helix-turn-helix transcriptional regulator [Thiofilum sp.]MBK8454302.1 helix-turn-helix transcriptional regulator [Thiofilum sp.]
MDAPTITSFIQPLTALFSDLGTEAFYQRLLGLIHQQVPADSSVVLLYQRGASPMILLDRMTERDRNAMQAHYFAGAYLLSPFYVNWLNAPLQDTLKRLADIAPQGFFESIYYRDYYGRSGLKDEMSYLIPLSPQSAILFSLGRSSELPLFSDTEKHYLQTIYSIVIKATQRHASLVTLPTPTKLKLWLEDSMQLFGKSILTEREQLVVQMMLQGHSSKSCAKLLGISPTTERVHRRNIYLKLNISSQAQLFKLFFAALSSEQLAQGLDPLMP